MQSFILPFGAAGWEEKKGIFEEIIASRQQPPFIYNDILILVPSARLKRLYGRFFLEAVERMHGSAALVPPEIQTMHQFLQQQYKRLNGPRLMDEISRLVLLEGLVKERLAGSRLFNQEPELLAPSLSSVLAKTIEQLSAASVGPEGLERTIAGTEFPDKPQVRLLLDVYAAYEYALQDSGLIDPAGMLALLYAQFDSAWLDRFRKIIIDGIVPMTAAESGILKKIADSGDSLPLLDGTMPDLVMEAGATHPLRIIREFVLSCGIALQQRREPSSADCYVASALFADRPFAETARLAPDPSSFPKQISVLSAVNMREEVSLIARAVKKSLKAGTTPDAILVAFPALDEYAPLAEEIFTDFGVPYNRALGRQLSSSPVTTALIALLRVLQEDFSGLSLLRVFSSPFLKWGAVSGAGAALDRLLREQKVTGGKERVLSALGRVRLQENEKNILPEPLKELCSALGPFSRQDAASLSEWMERLGELLDKSGIYSRAEQIKGPLNINLQARNKLKETLASLANAGRLFPDYCHTFDEWLFLLKKTLMHARFQVPPEDEGGVQILGVEESQGHPWKEIYLGGLTDASFPQRLPQNIFLPEHILEAMGVRTLERARLNAAFHFYRLLLSADRVMLTYPEHEGDRPVIASPFLEELAPLRIAGLINREITGTSGVQFSLKIEDSCSIPELAKAVAVAGEMPGLDSVPGMDIKGMSGIRAGLRSRQAGQASAVPLINKRSFSVTELDAYLNCPYNYYISYILGIEPLEEVSDDISLQDRGSKVHSVLFHFYQSWKKPVTRENREEAGELLQRLGRSAFDTDPGTFRNRREKDRFLSVMAPRFLDAEIQFWQQGMKPVSLEQSIKGYPLVLSNGQKVELSAKVDRIDADENGNFMIIDYKTGGYPQPVMNTDQKIFQLPVYAVMARTLSVEGTHGDVRLGKPLGLVYYDLAGKTGGGARDVVLFDKEARSDHPSSKPKASPKSAGEFEAILAQSMDKAREAVENILAGKFPAEPRDETVCRYCPNEMMCGEDDDE